ncbi:kinase-like domain-containing protein [Rhizophagus irregularis DAOM 181602=DAOM 197198]|uniref:Kinase-like domain-containing protein n=1 Tax=Rhizophagus irregularis (strain DAOM 181602 / DAOM 197198 / MUCL 43194) TaxID=747089 RepID=A0A2P4QM26_RHIID|nr:kinase-like domain-containing protein [Rhizophagus irregularis DAOM 181602=DAOM 197198]POG78665.1 kinase-like domain-containing protein [Rhizophagus irregularis DAOM 181602=DAOM 197198]GET51350.1 kinase-like domain-containing protein [Rhizophagus irregularis DAOM 181602=DAOM 197198]|eukprot:XP_025185531.1 kinase-like domain-containing protein [Rhizophagus irregularis DAOM 181602=DAOM 197198]
MDISNQNLDTTKPDVKSLWIDRRDGEYQVHATIFSTDATTESDETISFLKKVNIMDLEKRKEVYGVCGECNEPGTGWRWCQPCNAKRFKENFKNWTSGNKNIDELIQQSQLNAFFCTKCLEWIPFEKFENVTYLTRGGFSKIYSADRLEGNAEYWDIENQKWVHESNVKVALKRLDNSSNISDDFINEIKYYISSHFHASNTVMCFGITRDPNTKDYMMVLQYFGGGNLRKSLVEGLKFRTKMKYLFCIIDGLSGIHDAGNIHKDFHSGNILYNNHDDILSISDLGMCKPVNDNEQKGIYGVMPYMTPEVFRGYQYTKAADIYSFGIIMNELMSEEIPYNDIPHNHCLVVKICKGFRPKISEDTPKLIVDLIIKCWDAKAENRPTAKELCQTIVKYGTETDDENSEFSYQIKECEKIKENKLKNRTNENKSKDLQTHPQAIYTSRLLNFENLPEPVNSTETISSSSSNPISECLDCELNESDLNQDNVE